MRVESIHNTYLVHADSYEVTTYKQIRDEETNRKITEVETRSYQLTTYNKHGQMEVWQTPGVIVDIIA